MQDLFFFHIFYKRRPRGKSSGREKGKAADELHTMLCILCSSMHTVLSVRSRLQIRRAAQQSCRKQRVNAVVTANTRNTKLGFARKYQCWD